MTPRQVEVFRAIMRAGSVTEAAVALGVSQPAASKQLRLLEREVGFELFERRRNRLVATPEANALFEQVEMLYAGIEQLDRFAEAMRGDRHGAVTVASMPLLSHRWLPGVLGAFARDRPDVSLSVPVRSTTWILKAVAAGRVDLGCGLWRGREPGVEQATMMRLPWVCVFAPGHPLAAGGVVDPDDLARHDIVTLSNFEVTPLATAGLADARPGGRRRRRLEAFTAEFACEFARAGVGVAIVDGLTAARFTDDGLLARPLRIDAVFEIAMITPARRRESRLARTLRAHVLAEGRRTEAEIAARFAAPALTAPPAGR